MKRISRYRIAVWSDGEPEPEIKHVVLFDDWGTASDEIEEIRVTLETLRREKRIDRYDISSQSCNDSLPLEVHEWLESFQVEEREPVTDFGIIMSGVIDHIAGGAR